MASRSTENSSSLFFRDTQFFSGDLYIQTILWPNQTSGSQNQNRNCIPSRPTGSEHSCFPECRNKARKPGCWCWPWSCCLGPTGTRGSTLPLADYRSELPVPSSVGHSSEWSVLLPPQTHRPAARSGWEDKSCSTVCSRGGRHSGASCVSGHQPVFLPRSGTQGSSQQVMLELIQMQHMGGHCVKTL